MATLKDRFTEIIHLSWGEFIVLEQNTSASVDDTVLCSLVRACTDTDDISATKLAFDRIEGLLETPIDIKVPKFYIRFPNAKEIEGDVAAIEAPESTKKEKASNYDPATAKLRETLREMRKMPKDVIRVVRLYKRRIERGVPVDPEPKVKAVIVANLLKNVQKGRYKAIELIFEQIDGKLAKTIKLLGGEDVYVDDINTLIAPTGSILGDDGVYYAENKAMTTAWLRGFAQSQKGLEILTEGLDDN